MLVPCNRASALRRQKTSDRLYLLQEAYAQNNIGRVRALFDTVALAQKAQRTGDITLDRTFQEAWLRRAIGDTAGAIRQLDRILGALPSINASALQEWNAFPAAAATPRAMLLRAEMAAARGDLTTARKWLRAVEALWQKADPRLRAQLRAVSTLATGAASR